MNIFNRLASANAALWSLFAGRPLGFAVQSFVDPQSADSGMRPKAPSLLPVDIVDEPPAAKPHLPAAAPFIRPRRTSARNGHQWLSSHFEHVGQAHRFKLFVPSGYRGQSLPMVVMLHGAQQDPDDFAAGTAMNEAADAHGYIVAYPEQSESVSLLRCWNWFRPGDQVRESGEASMIAALTREVIATYNVDDARVYVAGMSAGGAMAVNLAVTHPDLYAAAAVHSGVAFGVAHDAFSALCAMNDGKGKIRLPARLIDGSQPRSVPLIVFHGDADDTVHPRNSDQIVSMRRLFQCQAGAAHHSPTEVSETENGYPYTRRIFHDKKGLPIGEQWLVHGLGHAWSGGDPKGTYTDARGPSATDEFLRFFDQFALHSPPAQAPLTLGLECDVRLAQAD
ncbi:polyhydroxybutyrate depolymerase domain-containing protein [Caballeronia arvi]|uniref:Polyhydroxybutyrate depolymerase domain-containing protein n=1 Tax=Caballeronia arvi TaxID=1777135 RepID=A0A158L192_9BURK|nr:PHB depolymerase family esterase [Caballeronia arvi]SAL86759.1 polyhydroxybutyrate depolymerase domain-containing protein [Caballeronia arvi]